MKKLNLYILLFLVFSIQASSYDLRELAKLFKEDAKNAPKDTYEDYLRSRPDVPLFISERQVFPAPKPDVKSKSVSKILVITESVLYPQIEQRVMRYINDISNAYNCTVVSQQASASIHPVALKNMIINEWNLGAVDGVVLIGNLPAGWFEIANDFYEYGYAEFPCDLFLMDLDGTWTDADSNGKYDSHTGSFINPEVFVGRISAYNMGNLCSELQGISDYFDKNHDFWTGVTPVDQQKGLTYTDRDWTPYSDFLHDISYLYGSYDAFSANDSFFKKSDYLSRIGGGVYEFVQLSCHSNWLMHRMYGPTAEDYEDITNTEIFNLTPQALVYNLFCCSGVRWTSAGTTGFLGGAYVYNSDVRSLASIGSTKTGSMLGFGNFYSYVSIDKAIGQALKNWWISYVGPTHDFDETCWFYGMSIIGDPMADPMYEAPYVIVPPANVSISRPGSDAILNWNSVLNAVSYSVYSSADPNAVFPSGWSLSAENVTTLSWTDLNPSAVKKFYVVTAVFQ
jgi:hypothetical protein